MSLNMSPEASETASNKERMLSSKTACRGFEPFCPCQNKTDTERYPFLFSIKCKKLETEARGACRGVRVSGGDLCEAEAPTEAAAETEPFCPCQRTLQKRCLSFFIKNATEPENSQYFGFYLTPKNKSPHNPRKNGHTITR